MHRSGCASRFGTDIAARPNRSSATGSESCGRPFAGANIIKKRSSEHAARSFLPDSNDRADAFRVKRTARNQDSHRLWQRIAGRGIRSATARIRAGPGGILLRLRSVRPVMRLAAPDGRRRPLRQAPPVGCGDIPTGPPATRPTGASGHCRANGTIGLPYGGKVGEPTAPRRQGIEA